MSSFYRELYTRPLRNILDASEEEILDTMAELEGLRHRYPKYKGFVAMSVGSTLNLCYFNYNGEWVYYTDIKVTGTGDGYLSREKSCDAMRSYLVIRYPECVYSAKRCTLDKDLNIIISSVTGVCSGDDACLIQRMCNDLQGKPIWLNRVKHKRNT